MNDVDSKPVNQGWSAAWLAVKFILAVPILGVVCAAFSFAIAVAAEMVEGRGTGRYRRLSFDAARISRSAVSQC